MGVIYQHYFSRSQVCKSLLKTMIYHMLVINKFSVEEIFEFSAKFKFTKYFEECIENVYAHLKKLNVK